MRKAFLRSLWIGLTMLLAGVYVIYQAHAHANGQGIGGKTQKGGNTTGCYCHCASASSATTVAFSTTATTIYTGQSYSFTVTVSNSSESGAGVEVAAQRGTLTAGTGTQVISGELTHSSAATSLPASWTFTYTAPSTSGTDTLFGTGNAVNLDGSNGGGNCTDVWNFSPKYVITVSDVPVTKAISLSRNTIALGSVRLGQTKKDTMQLRSTSTSAITVNTSLNSGTVFSRYPTTSNRSIASGTQEIDTIYFAPTSRGSFTDSLIITSDVDLTVDKRKAVYLTGSGIQAVYSGGSAVAFGNLRTNQTKLKSFVYSNTGDDTLFMQTPAISGGGFTIATQPTRLNLPPGGSDSVVVQFSPTAKQPYGGTLTLSATGLTIPSVTLSGTGVAPTIAVTSPTNIGGVRINLQTQGTVVLRNTGTDTLHISGVTLSGSNAARFNLSTHSSTIAPGGQGVVLVNYFPLIEKFDTAIVTVASDDASNPSVNITVIAQGLAPHIAVVPADTLDFGSVRINAAPASRTISVQNTGSDVLNLASAVVTPLPFTLKAKASSVDAGSSGIVSVNFAPTAVGPFTGSVTITSDDANKPTTVVYLKGVGINSALNIPSNVDFQGVATSTSLDTIITLQNTGLAGVNVLKYSLTDANGVFTVKDSSSHTIAGNSSIHLTLSFKPIAAQDYSGTLTLTTDYPNAHTLTIALAGHGLAGTLSTTPTTLDFGSDDSGRTVTLPIDITNTGTAGITVQSVTITGANAGAFGAKSATPTPPVLLHAADNLHVVVSFDPPSAGQFSAKLTITKGDGTKTDVALHGIGLSVGPILPDTTKVQLISTSTQNIVITLKKLGAKSWIAKISNLSGHRIRIDGIALKSGLHYSVSLTAPDSTIPFYLADQASMNVRITLLEALPGLYRDTLVVTNSEGIKATFYLFAIEGTLQSEGVASLVPKNYSITANPNPTHGQIAFNFEGLHATDAQVLDLVGRVVAEVHNVSGQWLWNGRNASGEIAPSGVYIIRTSGKSFAGETVTASTRIIVQH